MTVRLRKPRHDLNDTTLATVDDPVRNPPNRITLGHVCAGCRWADRCRRDRICWSAEKADIAREPPPRRWHQAVSRIPGAKR